MEPENEIKKNEEIANIKKFLINITPRDYQEEIAKKCFEKNCLVILPTGIGKTLIALILIINRMKKFPLEKILFLAPTRPLAEQHFNYLKKHLPELFGQIELFTGKIKPEERLKLWERADIIFSTPQCIANDLKNKLYELKEVSLLIEDECHRCIKNYSYTYVADEYIKYSKNPRILGLTASPGTDKKTIETICKNLSIEEVEIRTRESGDVKQYLQKMRFNVIELEFPEKFGEIRDLFKKIFLKKVEELKNRKLLFGLPTKINLLETQGKMMKSLSNGNKNFNIYRGVSVCAQALKIHHAIELIETQTLYTLDNYLKNLFEQANKNQSKAVKTLVKTPEFNKAYIMLQELIADNIEHPKLLELKDLINKKIEKNSKNKIIVFSNYRDSVTKICRDLNSIKIPSKIFIGQAKKGTGKNENEMGLSQKEQQEIISDFSIGKFNVLCATSIHPDEYIILKRNDKIMIKKIGEFVDAYTQEDNGPSMSKKIDGWEALTTNGKDSLFKPITHVHKHHTKNNAIKIKLRSGFDCFITENHSLFSFDWNNQFVPSTPEDKKFIALALKCKNIEKNKQIDVIKELSENCSKEEIKKLFGSLNGLNQARIRKLKTELLILNLLNKEQSIMELSRASKKDYSTVKDCLKRLKEKEFIEQSRTKQNYKKISKITSKGLKYLEFLKWFFENVKYSKGKYRFKLSNQEKNLKEFNNIFQQNINVNYGKTNFPRFLNINESLARFLGFYVSEGSTRKTKSTSDVFLAARDKNIQEMMKESIENGLKLKPKINWRGATINSQISYSLIKNVFKGGIGAYNKEVPEIIFTSPSKIKWAFLEAYYLGDGYSDKNKIVFTTVSRKLVTGLVLLLRMLNIKKISIYQQKHIYRLTIHESLPFAKIKKKNGKRGHAYFSLIPKALENEKAFSIYQNYYNSNQNKYMKSRKNGKWRGDICFDYIKKMEKLEKPKFVYDLSVKDTENFIGGTGLFCLHNSIGEEGLDIPEVNAVIFYEPVPSAIRKIQRTGRTARLMPGELITLITKNTRDETYYWSAFHKEKRMNKAINSVKEDLNSGKINFQENNEEMQKKLI